MLLALVSSRKFQLLPPVSSNYRYHINVQTLIVQPVPVASPLPVLSSTQNKGCFGTSQGSIFSSSLGSPEPSNLFNLPPGTIWPTGKLSSSTVTGGFGLNNQGLGSSASFGNSTNSADTKDMRHLFDVKKLPDTQGFNRV